MISRVSRRNLLRSLGALGVAAVTPASLSASTPGVSPTVQVTAALLTLKQSSVQAQRPSIPLQRLDVPPADSHSIVFSSAPYSFFPAPGAAAIQLLAYTVPQGFNAVINFMAIFAQGAGQINGTGNVIWRVLLNDSGWKGMNALLSQYGTDSLPLPVFIPLTENDTLQVTVEVANAAVIPGGAQTGARFHGYEYPLVRQ